MTILTQQFDYVIGVDTHARTHTLAVLDRAGVISKTNTFPTSPAGLSRAEAWIVQNAPGTVLVAMEGTSSYGAQFAQQLTGHGILVAETRPPRRFSRRDGKSDPIDAEAAARHATAHFTDHVPQPRKGTGDRAALQVLLTGRQAKNRERTAMINQLTALLRIHSFGVDARKPLSSDTISMIAKWRARVGDTMAEATIRGEVIRLAKAILATGPELEHNLTGLRQHVSALAPWLLQEKGIGPVVAAQILASYSHPGRVRTEAAFARLGGIAPIPASSGNTTNYRLHRGGDRQLNHALWVVAFNRMIHDPETIAYAAKRTAEGKTRKEILRLLKRYIIRATYRKLHKMA